MLQDGDSSKIVSAPRFVQTHSLPNEVEWPRYYAFAVRERVCEPIQF